ncbi:Rossmann-fold NAD(P)-binding domain-containing protein [Paenibacillus darwinianus]|uniref:hypothetical protein n=1 Tax=Paenibacillus darwinianus TaxID=1380763 RepID=UPI001681A30A|nr:hypothetical protein [Paenibacillus darwinianus]
MVNNTPKSISENKNDVHNDKTLVPERSNLYDHSLYFLYGFRIWNDGQNTAFSHRLNRIFAQIQKHLLQLVAICHNGGQTFEAGRHRLENQKCGLGYIYKRKGSTHYSIGNALAHIIRSILNDDHKVTAVSRQGVKEIGELILTDKEKEQFAGSCSIINQAIQLLGF